MLRNFLKNRKAQNTAEYALLIALVVAGVIAMQTYCQRALQARMHDASTYLASTSNVIGNSMQYEPYYQVSNYVSDTNSQARTALGNGLVGADSMSNSVRTGSQNSYYNPADQSLNTTL